MAPKNDSSKALQIKEGDSKLSMAGKTGSSSNTQSTGPVTRSKAKATAQTLFQASLLPKPSPVFGSGKE
ncbi:hypothetical protein U1Q18_017244, partial [Sarracenia purpurea var. burkii]